MRVVARSTLVRFVATLTGSRAKAAVQAALESWFYEVSRANWRNSAELKKHYATASILSAERVVFNIKGNDYRLVTAFDYQKQIIYIKWIGSHAEYDKIDAETVQFGG